MSKISKWVTGGIIGLLILYLIFLPKVDALKFWEDNPEPSQMSTGRSQRGSTLLVSGVVADENLLENKITVTGEVIPNESLELKSEISGKVDGIYFKEGTSVRQGQLLVKINVDELQAQLQKAQYTEKLRKETEFRQRQLLEREAISQEEYDQALTELQTAQADIQLLQTQISKSNIRAPFAGIIGLRNISLGAYITSSTVIAPLYSINPIKIQFAIPGRYVGSIKEGTEVEYTTDASEEVYTGEIYAKEPRVDANTRTLSMRAISANPDEKLLPGQFVKVEVILNRKEDVIMVPTQAVIPELNGAKVYVTNNGKVAEKKVETGIRTETHLEITSGLTVGDTVITTGILQVRTGMPVNVSL